MKLINDKRLFIIDSFIYIYKYYFYYKKYYKRNSILLGFTNFIINILITKQPTYIIVVFDGKLKKNYKKKIFFNYKLNRKYKINIRKYLKYIKIILNILNIQYISYKYIEADDIIGTIINKSYYKGYINYIYTEDKDYYQLISNRTFIINKNIIIDKKYVLSKYNIKKIKQYIDLISIIGDKSDNIPGIPYIGIKTANKLLIKYNNLENIYKNINNINFIIKKKIKKYKKLVFLFKKIIKINKNIKLTNFKLLNRKKINNNKIIIILNNINKFFFKKKIKIIKQKLLL